MSKNKMSGVSNILTEQAKERFEERFGSSAPSDERADKVRKNFYIEKRLARLLRKMAYEEETDQTRIVNAALKAYFEANGYE